MSKKRLREPSAHEIEAEGLPSASGFDAEFRCPGKRALCKRLPPEEDTAVAARGVRIHEALKNNDLSGLSTTEGNTASRIMYGESEIVHEYGFEGAHITFEERVWDTDDALNHTWSARVDRYDWQPEQRRLLVLDDKSGWALPPPIHVNWQVRSEAALLAEIHDAQEVVVGLIHPHHADSLWEAKVYSRKQSDTLLATTRELVKAIQLPNQRRVVGGIQCQWCVAKALCPEYKAHEAALDTAIAKHIEDQGFSFLIEQTKAERGVFVSSLKERARNIDTILEQYVVLAMRDGEAIDGWTLRRKLDRRIRNDEEAMTLVRQAYGDEVVADAIRFSLTAFEERLAKKLGGKRKAKEAAEILLAPVLEFKKSKYFLTETRSL